MNLTFAEDFSSSIDLDSELIGAPDSGLFWNRGVHPTLTVDNLLTFLPDINITFSAWVIGTTYTKFNTSRKKSDIVSHSGSIYQSLTDGNVGNTPDSSPANWLETDLNSLRIKSFIWTVEDDVLSALSLTRLLIENQYIYNLGKTLQTNVNDFFGWAFEPKGSDYVTIRINSISFQADTDVAQDLYVINQGRLIDTLALNPNNGLLEFEELNYSFSGKGTFYFVVIGQDFYSEGAYNDSLKYSGFVCYPVIGVGATPEDSDYSISNNSNGLNFNVSCFLDSSTYIQNNKIDLAKFYQTQFEYDFIRMLAHNSNSRFGIEERIQKANPELIAAESLDVSSATVARKYSSEKKRTIAIINKTFDKFLHKKQGLKVKRKVM